MESRTPAGPAHVEIVTAAFVAAGTPEGVHDLGRFLENLNNPALGRHLVLANATLRPLYRAASPLLLDAPLLARRDEIVFATFDGPHTAHPVVRPPTVDARCLLLAPPFQIQGDAGLQPGAERSQALRAMMAGFFALKDAHVYDADGYLLGEGRQVIVNGAAVQMLAPTRRHIEAFAEHAGQVRRAAAGEASPAPGCDAEPAAPMTRAA